jgi:hypothetical protein
VERFGVSECLACRVLGQHRSTQRKKPKTADDEPALTADIIALAKQYGRYGYRRITALLRAAGWRASGFRRGLCPRGYSRHAFACGPWLCDHSVD